jgi:putative spermidine/putrescine transport system ATP-binding protein
MPSAGLRLSKLGKRYGALVALAPTDLEVAAGEFLTLLGPSGSGKTTLLSLIAGLAEPDSGEVWLGADDITLSPPYERAIGMVFQNYALFPHMTVADNIAFPLRMRKTPEAETRRKVAEALDMVRLPQVAQRYPRELSGGQQQRIALARCVVYRPSLILMDEPLGALDKKLREQMQLEIRRIHRELGATIVYVTHDQEEAMTMSDRICLMNAGCIAQLGSPADLYFRPRSLFVADFLGESNLLPGRIIGKGDSVTLLVRPQNISLLPAGTGTLAATVVDTTVSGSLTRVYLTPAETGLPPLVAAYPTRASVVPHRIGEAVGVAWDASEAVILPDESPAP